MQEDYPLKDYYSDIYRTYDRVNSIFTFGRDVVWRRRAVKVCLEGDPGNLLDVCTGTGDFILEAARQSVNPGKKVVLTGFDFSRAMLDEAERKLEVLTSGGRVNPDISFLEGEVGRMPFESGTFEAMGITFGIRNLLYENSSAALHLQELFRVLKPGGKFVVLESSRPANVFWRLFNNIYLRFILPYLGGIVSGNLKAYRYLARSSRNYYSITEMASILEEAGFSIISRRSFFLGSVMMLVAGK